MTEYGEGDRERMDFIDGKSPMPQRMGKYKCPGCKQLFASPFSMREHFEKEPDCKLIAGLFADYIEKSIKKILNGGDL